MKVLNIFGRGFHVLGRVEYHLLFELELAAQKQDIYACGAIVRALELIGGILNVAK